MSAKSNIATHQPRHKTTTVDNAFDDEYTYVAPDQATANSIGDSDDIYLSHDHASANRYAGEGDNVYFAPDQAASSDAIADELYTYTPTHAVSGGLSLRERLATLRLELAVPRRANRAFYDYDRQLYANSDAKLVNQSSDDFEAQGYTASGDADADISPEQTAVDTKQESATKTEVK